MESVRVTRCVETMCQKGCKALWEDIAALEQGAIPRETKKLDFSERNLVLEELKSIMSVYATSCKPANTD